MSSSQYLYRRESNTYHVRLCVPVRLKAAVGQGEIHRTTGCRDFRIAVTVAAELAARWHRAIQSLGRLDVRKVKAGSINLLGDGFVTLVGARRALSTSPLTLAQQLIAKQAPFSAEASRWTGWAVADIYQALDHSYDEAGQLEVMLDAEKRGGPQAQTKVTGRLQLRFHDEVLAVVGAEAPIGREKVYLGRKPSYTESQVAEVIILTGEGKGVSDIAKRLRVSHAAVYGILKSPSEAAATVRAWH